MRLQLKGLQPHICVQQRAAQELLRVNAVQCMFQGVEFIYIYIYIYMYIYIYIYIYLFIYLYRLIVCVCVCVCVFVLRGGGGVALQDCIFLGSVFRASVSKL